MSTFFLGDICNYLIINEIKLMVCFLQFVS